MGRALVLSVFLLGPLAARAEPADSTADYVIRARLDPETHTVTGVETVRLVNRSARAVDQLVFHLYLNAFANDETLWMRESRGEMRGARLGEYGTIDVTGLDVRGTSLLDRARLDETLLHVPLPRPVEPGASVEAEIAFTARLPTAFARTGFAGDFHMVAQWFPKLALLSPDGTFAARPYHASHEYYADFGAYEVTIDVPHGWIVGATGERVAAERRSDRDVVVYRAADVHDFAWAASPRFEERTFRAGRVKVRSLSQPGQSRQVERQLRTIRRALPRFERLLGPYPYPVLTVVSPPEDALGAGGMEYPTLITTGSRFLGSIGNHFDEEVAVHELGHQWFYGLVATNEPDEAWLDEGLNTYVTGRIMDELFGKRTSTADFLGLRVGYGTLSRIARRIGGAREPVAQRSSDFSSLMSYATHVYYGTDLLMRTLAGRVGEDRLSASLGRYARTTRMRHPATQDLLAILREDLGDAPIRELVEPVLLRAGRFDVRVASVESERVMTVAGYVRRHGKRELAGEPRPARPPRYRTTVLVTRDGEVRSPVAVDVLFANGSRRRVTWDGHERWKRIELVGPHPATGAIADPGLALPLDENLLDGSRAAPGSAGGTSRLWLRLMYLAQTVLQVLGP
ncbi:MAG: M1 family metallopeptidase [Deltaproteobacteria bacterium]|nr:M1 family metallopeptidase [Deltaproteobacteria bacterium]